MTGQTLLPGTREWRAYEVQRDRILQEARDKGWQHWQGNFFHHLEEKLLAISCPEPEHWIYNFRLERAEEASEAGIENAAERQLLLDVEEAYSDA